MLTTIILIIIAIFFVKFLPAIFEHVMMPTIMTFVLAGPLVFFLCMSLDAWTWVLIPKTFALTWLGLVMTSFIIPSEILGFLVSTSGFFLLAGAFFL